MENEDDDPVGAAAFEQDYRELFRAMAVSVGAARAGDRLDQNMVDFARDVAGICAAIGDAYVDDSSGRSAGDCIRERLCGGAPQDAFPSARLVGSGPRDPVARFTALATDRRLIRPGDKLDKNIIDFATCIVESAAASGEAYGDSEGGGNAGEHIRAELYEA